MLTSIDVEDVYRIVLDREPEGSDVVDYWIGRVKSKAELIKIFVESEEYKSRHNIASAVNVDEALADSAAIEAMFNSILGRSANDEKFLAEVENKHTINYWVKRLVESDEFAKRFEVKRQNDPRLSRGLPDRQFRVPSLSERILPERILVTGSCLSEVWRHVLNGTHPEVKVEHILFNNASDLPDISDEDLKKYSFQVAQIPVRSLISDGELLSSAFSSGNDNEAGKLFEECVSRLARNIAALRKYSDQIGIPLLFLNFAVPQISPLGRLLPRYSLSNYSYFVSRLNQVLDEEVRAIKGAHVIDFDGILSSLGKRYFMDDVTSHGNHASFMGAAYPDYELNLTPVGSYEEIFNPKVAEITLATFNECCAVHETIVSDKKVKLVIFDLDGTLWRGVAADGDDLGPHMTEGWPLGMLEAAAILRNRGILIAIASKNEYSNVESAWNHLYGKRFPLDRFVSVKANWNPKVQNIGEILAETNLLPGNVLFVDDNPVEREQIKFAYPDMYVIDGPVGTWRRTLLWASELQVPYITEESKSRTESIKSMVAREQIKAQVSDQDYVASLQVVVRIGEIENRNHRRFPRAFELLNKTNQFNSTGRRWTESEIESYFIDGGVMICADVSDRLSEYGMTAVMLYKNGECTQFVMSCRVFGLRVEFSLADYVARKNSGLRATTYLFKKTEKNGPFKNFLVKLDFPESMLSDAEKVNELSFGKGADFLQELSLGVTVERDERK